MFSNWRPNIHQISKQTSLKEREIFIASSGQRSRVCSSGPENASVQNREGGGHRVRQQDQCWQLQLSRGPVPPEEIHQLPPDPELSAVNTDSGGLLGLLLDGHRVCSWQNISGGHHPTGCLSASYGHFSATDFIRQGLHSQVMSCYLALFVTN